MSLFFIISAVFFTFPLLSPAVGMVLYPFLLLGVRDAIDWRIPTSRLLPLMVCGAAGMAVLGLVDPVSAARTTAFFCGLCFLHVAMQHPAKREFMLSLMKLHAWVVIAQLLLVLIGVEIDFSQVLRAIYGPLLPPTGIHIDYNAFSQFDLFLPRVAGLSREPAFASVLFVGMTFIALRMRRRLLAGLFTVATLCTLSKIVFPLILALLFVWRTPAEQTRTWRSMTLNFLFFVAIHLVVIAGVAFFIEETELAMQLDASFYHRIIGLHTFATQWDVIHWFGNGIDDLSRADIFQNYEFLDDRRAFLDGSVTSKLAADFGYAALFLYALLVSFLCTRWTAVLAVAIGGIFINLISVSPATIMFFWVATGLFAQALGEAHDVQPGPSLLRRIAFQLHPGRLAAYVLRPR
ncbi:hypothetical protein SAMN05216359_102254 [Roseateles sp. YR242]|uniref:hypothetical protein n=1 Tax=Roseateles sp. YR242 TaxID=1855305 RepID=UPI0008B374BE|nr:hypothetical protein [Roseateles sp. YR242]SEK57475.1 hypothetical protein SAMN05216359_102254 [Roseateles sp. YR242]